MKKFYLSVVVLTVSISISFSQNISRHVNVPDDVGPNTVALWHFDEGAGNILHDASSYHNDGEIHNASWVTGQFGSALHFDGYTSYVILPNSSSLKMEGDFTLEAWISIDTLWFPEISTPDDRYGYIVSNIGPYPYGGGYGFDIRNLYGIRLDYRPLNDLRNDFGGVPVTQTHHWYHVAGVYTRTSLGIDTVTILRTYINGVLEDSLVFPQPVYYDNTPYFYIGSELAGRALGGPVVREFHGNIDEIRISNVALTPDQFDLHPPVQVPPALDSNTVALWHFDEGSGNILHDASPYHNDGQIYNCEWVDGKFGKALRFNGLTSYVVIPNSTSLKTQDHFTVEAWINPDTLQFDYVAPPDVGAGVVLGNMGLYPYGGGYDFGLHTGQGLLFGFRIEGSSGYVTPGVSFPPPHHFYHIAATYSRNVSGLDTLTIIKLYINGEVVDSNVYAQPIQYDQTPFYYLGTGTNGRALGGPGVREFHGIIDEIRLSNAIRNPNEFSQPQLITSKQSLDFGLVKINQMAVQNLTISNASFTDTLHVDSVTSTSPYFSVNHPSFTLPPSSSFMLDVQYIPALAEVDTGILIIRSRELGVPQLNIKLSGKGFVPAQTPAVFSIKDIPNDQGKQVRVKWYASTHDTQSDPLGITEYSLWRRVDDSPALAKFIAVKGAFEVAGHRYRIINGELWDFIVTIPAVYFSQYSYVSPTLFDSTRLGIRWSVFKVAAHASTGEFFFSDPDSGYSVDNLTPSSLSTVNVDIASDRSVSIHWQKDIADPDVKLYEVHRSTTSGFTPNVGTKIAATEDTAIVDTTPVAGFINYYRIVTIDNDGNQSLPSVQVGVPIGEAHAYNMSTGWNMVSAPLTVADYSKLVLYPNAASNAFAYEGRYVIKGTLANGIGYWLRFNDAQSVSLIGIPTTFQTIAVNAGWNLIGSISSPVDVTTIASNPPGIVTSQFFGYNGMYFPSTTIEAGKAYWVKVRQAGQLTLLSSSESLSNRIRIIPTNELPPSPPTSDAITDIPTEYSLRQNFPNPFNPVTTITYGVPAKSKVILVIVDILGREVAKLVDESKVPGVYTVQWTPLGASGIYFYRLSAFDEQHPEKSFTQIKEMLFVK